MVPDVGLGAASRATQAEKVGAMMVRKRGKNYYAVFIDPATGRRLRKSLRCTDKGAAEILEGELVRRAAMEHAGMVNPYEQHHKRPLTEHVDDWHAGLLANGATQTYADLSRKRVQTVLDAIQTKSWNDLDPNRISGYLAERRRKGLSIESSNHYARRVKQFCRWLVRTKRAPDSPVECLRLLNSRTDRRHDRRAFDLDELRQLLNATQTGRVRIGMTGPDRAMLYKLAVSTGFRAGELRSLTPLSFDLDADLPTVTVAASFSKHRREDVQPIREDLADALRGYLDGRDLNEPVFPMPQPSGVSRMLQADLRAARRWWIRTVGGRGERRKQWESGFLAYRDDAGQVLDFHAFRHTFITNLALGGVHPKTAQQLARHSTIALTMDRYTHTTRTAAAAALDALPDLAIDSPECETLRATGTCDAGRETVSYLCQKTLRAGVKRSATDRTGVNDVAPLDKRKTPEKQGFSACFAGDSATEGVGARTQDLRLKRPLLYH